MKIKLEENKNRTKIIKIKIGIVKQKVHMDLNIFINIFLNYKIIIITENS